MKEGKVVSLKQVGSTSLGLTLFFIIATGGVVLGSQELAKKSNEKHNIAQTTEQDFGLSLYIKEVLTLPLPGNVNPEKITFEVSDGSPAILANPKLGQTPYYNTITLESKPLGIFKVTGDDSGKIFDENKAYNSGQISRRIRANIDLHWIKTTYDIPEGTIFKSNSFPTEINNALNESAKKGYEDQYDKQRVFDTLKLQNIRCGYSNNATNTIVYCRYYFSDTKTNTKFNLATFNDGGDIRSEATIFLDGIAKRDENSNLLSHSIEINTDDVKKFLDDLKFESTVEK